MATAEDVLTWLNGRAIEIKIRDGGKTHVVWTPKDATSIEDMVLAFAKERGINIEAEIEHGSIAAHVTPAMVEAAQDVTGYDSLDAGDVARAQDEWRRMTTVELRRLLRNREREFERAGGRGSELADQIDSIRIALATRPRNRKKAA